MRQWNSDKKVYPKNIDWHHFKNADVVIMSDEDLLGFESEIPYIASLVEILILTKGEEGAILYYKNKEWHFPAFPSQIKELTGAGDVFAVAFVLKYAESKDLFESVAYGNVASSLSIEGVGVEQLPRTEDIERRLEIYHQTIKAIQLK